MSESQSVSRNEAGYQADKALLSVLNGTAAARPPVWLMRQAGRYLPEYRALRAEKGGFLDLVYDSDAAAEVTMQPIRRFGFDGAILFSDILVIPYALGQDLSFVAGEGPRLRPRLEETPLSQFESVPERLDAIYATIGKVKAMLPSQTSFLGFAGSAWTVATYMVNGEGSRDQNETRRFAYDRRGEFEALIEAIVTLTVEYLCGQVDAGVEAVQLFDSWAGSLSPAQFNDWVVAPNAEIVRRFKARHPSVPVIGFPKGAGGKLASYVEGTGVDAIALDETVDPRWAARELPATIPVQGNLDPLALIAGGDALNRSIDTICEAFAGRPHIFNLGHGILPDTPIAHVEALLERVRG